MNIPGLASPVRSRDILTAFGGINRSKVISDGEFADMENLSTKNYPCLSVRGKRLLLTDYGETVVGMLAKDSLCVVTSTAEQNESGISRFYYAGEEISAVSALLLPSGGERQLVSMGAEVIIFPDKVRYNTVSGQAKALERTVTIPASSAGDLTAELCMEDGTSYSGVLQSAAADSAENGAVWLDISGAQPVLRVFSAASGTWNPVPTTFVKLSHPLLGTAGGEPAFKAYDTVQIAGMSAADLNGSFTVYSSGAGWIVVAGIFSAADEGSYGIMSVHPASGNVSFSRLVPELDFVVESENRLWGCRYGGGVNSLYACKLGDPENWNSFSGLASDSYAVSLGSDGAFTGAAVLDGSVIFFKENMIHKVFGSKPSNFQVTSAQGRGIRSGCHKSAVIVDETLYYLSKSGVVAYNGGIPVSVSEALGTGKFINGVAGASRGRYYICMTELSGGKRNLWCLDTARMIWTKENEADISFMTSIKDDIFACEGTKLFCLDSCGYEGNIQPVQSEGEVSWFAESGDLGMNDCDGRYYSFLQLRFEAEENAEIRVAFQFDSSGEWVEKFCFHANRKRAVTVPFVTPRCDHFKIRLSGKGECTLYSLSKFIEEGGDAVRG